MDNKKHFQCWCNAVCCCHSHIIFQLMHISLWISPLFSQKKKNPFHSTRHIQTLKKRVLWLIGAFVFQCFFWPICMRWFIFIINIFNNAEQCVLIVWLYFSFINECKCKVSVWSFFLCVVPFLLLNIQNTALCTAYEVMNGWLWLWIDLIDWQVFCYTFNICQH